MRVSLPAWAARTTSRPPISPARRWLRRRPRWTPTRSGIEAGDLRALEGQVVHQALVGEDEADHRLFCGLGVDRAARAQRRERDAAVTARSPALAAAETGECVFVHEQHDLAARLRAELKADRGC